MINYIETHLVEHCNLKCRGCSHFSGLAQPYFKSHDDFNKEFQALSNLTNHNIQTIRLMGGEPLLHPHLIDFCKTARALFPRSEIVLVSNGILLHQLSDEMIQELNWYQIALCVSNYGINIDREKMNQFKIHYFHDKNDMYNISLDLEGAQNPIASFNGCDLVQGGWYFFKNYRLYQCCIMANIDYFINHFDVGINYSLDDISIDIRNHSLEEVEKFLRTPHDACRYCDTARRHNSYQHFATSKGDIKEWTR